MTGALAVMAGASAPPLSVSISPASADALGAASSQTTNSVTATALNGIGSVSYSWALSPGGSGITIGSPSSATTTFSATGLSTPETRGATATVTVNDSVGIPATAFIPVTIERT